MTTTPRPSITTHPLTGSLAGPFATGWNYADPTDVRAWIEIAGHSEALLAQGSDYVLTGSSPMTGGGTVTLSSALIPSGGWAANTRLLLRRRTARRQAVALPDTEGHKPRATERALDKQMLIAEEDRDDLDRALLLPHGVESGSIPWSPGLGERFVTIDADGRPRVVERPEDFDGLNKVNRDGGNLEAGEAALLREAVAADALNTASAYGDVDVTGGADSALALRANLADRTTRRVKLPVGVLKITQTLIDDNSGEAAYPPRRSKSLIGAGSDQTFVEGSINNGYALEKLGGDFLSGAAQENGRVGGMTLRGGAQAYGRKGLRIERWTHAELFDMRIMEFEDAGVIRDVVGIDMPRVDILFCRRGLLFEPGPDIDAPGNPGSPPNEIIWKGHHIGNLDYSSKWIRCGNIIFNGGSDEGFGSSDLSGHVQAPGAACHIFENCGNNAGNVLTVRDRHHETNRGYAVYLIRPGSRSGVYAFDQCDFFQNGIEITPGRQQCIDHAIVLDLTDQAPGVVTKITLKGCSFLSVNGADLTGDGPVVHVINPNNLVEGRDYFLIDQGGNYFENPLTAPRFTNKKHQAMTGVLDSFTGAPTAYSVAVRHRRDGELAFWSGEITIADLGAASGAIYLIGTGVLPRQDTPITGYDNSGQAVRGILQAGTQNALITKTDGAFVGASGVTIRLNGTVELQPGN